jgi:hypothetical protein
MTAMGAPWGLNLPAGSGPIREYLYVQMWVSFWAGNYTIGEMSDSNARGLGARELFRSKAGRSYWAAIGPVQLANSTGRRNRFFRLLDEEYKKAISGGTPVAEAVKAAKAGNALTKGKSTHLRPARSGSSSPAFLLRRQLSAHQSGGFGIAGKSARHQMTYKSALRLLIDLVNDSQTVALNARCGPPPATALESRTNTRPPERATSTQLPSLKLQELLRQSKFLCESEGSSMLGTVQGVSTVQHYGASTRIAGVTWASLAFSVALVPPG